MDLTKKLMKTRLIIGMVIGVSAGAFAQEYDDMYFRSKDRETLATSVSSTATGKDSYSTFKKKHFEEVTMLDEYVNPSDSYSARNINPEYIARSSSAQATADEGNYFVEGYTPEALNALKYISGYNTSNLNSMNNSWYNPSWFGPSFYGAHSPYSYYGMNDPWMMNRFGYGYGMNDPWMMNPYRSGFGFNQGWSLSMNSFWGNSFGGSFFNPYYGNSWGMSPWNNFYCPTNYRPNNMIVTDNSRTNYSKRPSNNSVTTDIANRNNRTSPGVVDNSNSRSRTSDDYYVRPSRRTYTDFSSSSNSDNFSGGRTSGNTYRSYDNSRSNFSSPSRSSGSSNFSAPSRSSSSGSVGSSSGSSGGSRRGGN